MKCLVFGGAGYIGATTAHLLVEAGHEVVVFDNLSTGHGENIPPEAKLIEADIQNPGQVNQAFEGGFDVVLHFAAKIRVDESMEKPKTYFLNNTFGALNIIDATVKNNIKNIIFSSTAAVYGQPEKVPIPESAPLKPINPYGASKLMVEQLLQSYQNTHSLNWVAFRYFNAAGAYRQVGPDYPFMTHLIPVAINALSKNKTFQVFGNDYPTRDGTCIRDFVHVEDIARAHLTAAEKMQNENLQTAINLGSNTGHSVVEVLEVLNQIAEETLEYEFTDRRPGDPAKLIASNQKAKNLIGWKPKHGLSKIIEDAMSWAGQRN